ncbi:MAG: fused MFS/spermidine synthase [Planctomycetales bacterium]|nr:fused MFS/spermidine synthase [Planctomycetales bacterium]
MSNDPRNYTAEQQANSAWQAFILALLFVGSGCAALIYEIVWFQLLQIIIGSSAVSLATLLGTFMGGMCLGSLLLPRLVSARHHPLLVYGAIELCIGLMAICLLQVLPHANQFYVGGVGSGIPSVLLRGILCGLLLLPPTALMGATLPAVARWVRATPQGVSQLGMFYGANTFGAVLGCLLAGFYFLRLYDITTTTYVAVAINLTVAGVSLSLHRWLPYQVPNVPLDGGANDDSNQDAANRWSWSKEHWTFPAVAAYFAIAISGACGLAAEVLWTRQLSLLLGATVYTFSIILAVFLIGLGLGSSGGAFLSRRTSHPRLMLGLCQAAAMFALAWTGWQTSRCLPYWPLDVSLPCTPWITFQLDFVRCLWAFLPATVLWGASFPLAIAAIADQGVDSGRLVGRVYAANTLGAIVGAVGTGLLGIALLGTQRMQQLVLVLSAVAAMLMLTSEIWPSGGSPQRKEHVTATKILKHFLALLLLVLVTCGLASSIPKLPDELIGYGRNMPTWYNPPTFLFVSEGMNASIAVSEFEDGTRNFHVSGKVVASSEPQDMRLQRMLGHIPALLHPEPKQVLVVGCGAGVTAGSFLVHPSVQRVVVCEIEPLIPAAATKYFAEQNYALQNDPRVVIVNDDARHFIATTNEKFDIITSDPIHPWVKGAAVLYSREYYGLCQKRLNPNGLVTQWIPLYESNFAAVQSEIATFMDAFGEGTLWSNEFNGGGYDLIALGQLEELHINADLLQERLNRDDHQLVQQSLQQVGLGAALGLLQTYAGQRSDFEQVLSGAQVNHDRDLRLQYLAGLGLNQQEADAIYARLMSDVLYPERIFDAAGKLGQQLKLRLQLKHEGR